MDKRFIMTRQKLCLIVSIRNGMMAQDPVKHSPVFQQVGDWENDDITDEELLGKYNQRAFLAYQWGVWVTAHSRDALERGMKPELLIVTLKRWGLRSMLILKEKGKEFTAQLQVLTRQKVEKNWTDMVGYQLLKKTLFLGTQVERKQSITMHQKYLRLKLMGILYRSLQTLLSVLQNIL